MTAATRKAAQRARDKAAGLVTIPPIRAPAELAAWIAEQAQARTCTRREIILEALEQARANTQETDMTSQPKTLQTLVDDDGANAFVLADDGNGCALGLNGVLCPYDDDAAEQYGDTEMMLLDVSHISDDGAECSYASDWIVEGHGDNPYRVRIYY